MKATKLILLSIISFSVIANENSAIDFSNDLRNLIIQNDRHGLSGMLCPTCSSDKPTLDCILENDGSKKSIASFFKENKTNVRIFGPYKLDDTSDGNDFSIVYYNPKLVIFDKKGFMPKATRENLWGIGYVETVIRLENSAFYLLNNTFYCNSHLPWVEDYG